MKYKIKSTEDRGKNLDALHRCRFFYRTSLEVVAFDG